MGGCARLEFGWDGMGWGGQGIAIGRGMRVGRERDGEIDEGVVHVQFGMGGLKWREDELKMEKLTRGEGRWWRNGRSNGWLYNWGGHLQPKAES